MAIYGTELALWIGIMMCGGYYNLLPWFRRVVSRKRQREEEDESQQEQGRDGDVVLHDMPSSTSVFRTPSSVLVERSVQR